MKLAVRIPPAKNKTTATNDGHCIIDNPAIP